MATLTIRDLDDDLKQRLRLRAAGRNRSMEEEARQILRAALTSSPATTDLVSHLRSLMASVGPVELPAVSRQGGREPPDFSDPSFDPRPPRTRKAARK